MRSSPTHCGGAHEGAGRCRSYPASNRLSATSPLPECFLERVLLSRLIVRAPQRTTHRHASRLRVLVFFPPPLLFNSTVLYPRTSHLSPAYKFRYLSHDEKNSLHSLVVRLANYGTVLTPTKPKRTSIASSEVYARMVLHKEFSYGASHQAKN